jgi:hypothetical protein
MRPPASVVDPKITNNPNLQRIFQLYEYAFSFNLEFWKTSGGIAFMDIVGNASLSSTWDAHPASPYSHADWILTQQDAVALLIAEVRARLPSSVEKKGETVRKTREGAQQLLPIKKGEALRFLREIQPDLIKDPPALSDIYPRDCLIMLDVSMASQAAIIPKPILPLSFRVGHRLRLIPGSNSVDWKAWLIPSGSTYGPDLRGPYDQMILYQLTGISLWLVWENGTSNIGASMPKTGRWNNVEDALASLSFELGEAKVSLWFILCECLF